MSDVVPRGELTRIVASGVRKTYGATPALRGVSLEVHAGEIVLLTGPNGAGKSTLLSILGTQLRASRGDVAYLDASGARLDRRTLRSQLGWVSHESHCYAQLSGRENIELFAELHGIPANRYEEVAERVALGRFAQRPLSTLSRGQKQRVALARSLVHRPRLLLLDEPWTGLDHSSSELLEHVVREEADAGNLVLVVSHAPDLAARLGARRVHLVRGQVAAAPPESAASPLSTKLAADDDAAADAPL